MPEYEIGPLSFHDVPRGRHSSKAIGANVSVTAYNPYPVSADIPALQFEILVPGCDTSDPYITVAEAATDVIHVRAKSNVTATPHGIVKAIPDSLIRACPSTALSPLDSLMHRYLAGDNVTVYVRCESDPKSDDFLGKILYHVMVPVTLPGKPFGDVIRNFSLSDVDFKLPSPFADPKDPNSQPRVSGTGQVLAALPAGFNVDIGVNSIRAYADLFYHKKKMGELNLDDWQKANSTKLIDIGGGEDLLNITTKVVDVPLKITDGDVFSDVLSELLWGDETVLLDIDATVDVNASTVLGPLVIKGVPAAGQIPVKRNTFTSLKPQLQDIRIVRTSDTSITLQAKVDVTNPTPYTATIPFLSIHVYKDAFMIGEAIVRDLNIRQGPNTGIDAEATWDPQSFGGDEARLVGRKLISDYISGKNTTFTLKAHRGSIPTLPALGEALSKINITLPAPRLRLPGGGNNDGDDGDDDEDAPSHFIRSAIFHLFSSTANFVLASPLKHNIIYIERINATAYYNHTEPVARIIHAEAFPATPGLSQTPKLPVDWSADDVGYGKLRDALGGSLKLDAEAEVLVRLGSWTEEIHYSGRGIGAHVRL